MTAVLRYGRLLLLAFGWKGLVRRAAYTARLHTGLLKRQLPPAPDFSSSPALDWHHRFDLDAIRHRYAEDGLNELVRARVIADAERVLAGELQLYGDRWHDVGWPPRWHVNAFTGYEYPKVHWSEINDDDPKNGDIKDVWELSRLPFTFLFARAHVLTGDDRFVEAWWQAIEDWATHNPPNLGVNWRCGQETSLRAIALCFGLSTFVDHPLSTPSRLELASRILGASVQRVRPTVGYALSQRNNHAVSELAFLLSIRATDRSLLRLLLEVLNDQFYPDGSYGQQSFTYQRLAVQALQWLLLCHPDLAPGAHDRLVDVLARSRDFLARCSDPVSGWLPNYGPSDGALLLHLDCAHYRDFRPLLTSLGGSFDGHHREPALWIDLPNISSHRTDAVSRPTTYHTLRGRRSLAFTRVGSGRHRAGHGDQQMLDLWLDGRNVVVDPGTFRYTAPTPWRNALTGPEVHSTPQSPRRDGLALGRFLAEGMPDAEVVHRGAHGELEILVSRRPMSEGWLWRAIARSGDAYTIVDAADGVGSAVRWNLADTLGLDIVRCPGHAVEVLVPSDHDPTSGWIAPVYASRRPAKTHIVELPDGGVRATKFARSAQEHLTDTELAILANSLPRWIARKLANPRPSDPAARS